MGHTKEELCEIVEISKEDADYHLKLLIAARLVKKRSDDVYEITEEGEKLMNQVGITKEKVLELAKEVMQNG